MLAAAGPVAGSARVPVAVDLVDLVALAVLALAQVAAGRAHRVPLRLLARWPVLDKAHRPVPAVGALAVLVLVVRAGLPVLAGLVVAPVARLLNLQWFSAAMARTTP